MGFAAPISIRDTFFADGFSGTNPTTLVEANNAKPATYTELEDSAPYDIHGLYVLSRSVGDNSFLVDIAIGAASSEVIVAPDLTLPSQSQRSRTVYLPLFIPAGSRISGRCSYNNGTNDCKITLVMLHRPNFSLPLFHRITAYGATLADSGGISVDPGGSANTMGAYSEITSSTTYNHSAWFFMFSVGSNFIRADGSWLFNFGLGAAASEVEILSDYPQVCDGTFDEFVDSQSPIFYQSIPSGTRIAAQSQSTITNAADRLIDVIVYGLD